LQRLQNNVLRTTGSFPRLKSVRDMHVAFQIQYVYDYIKLYRRKAEIIYDLENENVRILEKAKPHTENIKGFNWAAVIYTTVQGSRLLR
jgi:hypothetical protein